MNRALFPDLKAFELGVQIFYGTGGTEKVDKTGFEEAVLANPHFL